MNVKNGWMNVCKRGLSGFDALLGVACERLRPGRFFPFALTKPRLAAQLYTDTQPHLQRAAF